MTKKEKQTALLELYTGKRSPKQILEKKSMSFLQDKVNHDTYTCDDKEYTGVEVQEIIDNNPQNEIWVLAFYGDSIVKTGQKLCLDIH